MSVVEELVKVQERGCCASIKESDSAIARSLKFIEWNLRPLAHVLGIAVASRDVDEDAIVFPRIDERFKPVRSPKGTLLRLVINSPKRDLKSYDFSFSFYSLVLAL